MDKVCPECLEKITSDINKAHHSSSEAGYLKKSVIGVTGIKQESFSEEDINTLLGIVKESCPPIKNKPLGIKHDAEKLEWSLLPLAEIEDVIKVLMHGSKKYSPNNWKFVKPKERYIDAAFRHLAARAKGEIIDDESGLSHLAHMVCCGLFLMWHDAEDVKE